jgi:hypothetical protein
MGRFTVEVEVRFPADNEVKIGVSARERARDPTG